MAGTRVVKEVVAEVRASTDKLDADLAQTEQKLGRTKRNIEGLGGAAGGLGQRYGNAARQIASATEEIARSGNVAGGAAKQILTAGSSIAFAFGPGGAIIGALSIFGLAISQAMGRARDEARETAEAFDAELRKIGQTRDYRGAGSLLTRILVGDPAARERELQIPLQQLEEEIRAVRDRTRRTLPGGGTEELATASRAERSQIARQEAILADRRKNLVAAQALFDETARLEQERLATGKKIAEEEAALLEARARVAREFAEASRATQQVIAEFDRDAATFGRNFERFALNEIADAAAQVAAEFDELIEQGRRTAGASDPRVQQLEAYKVVAVEATRALERTRATFESLERAQAGGSAPGADAFSQLSLRAEELNAQLATLVPRSKLYLQVQQELLKVERERSKILDKVAKAEGRDGAQGASRTAADLAREIQQAVDGALQLAQAFGGVEASAARALRAVSQIAGNLPGLQQALTGGSAIGLVGAALPIVGALASLFGDSPADEARRDALRKNTEAIKELTARAGVLGINVSAGDAQRALADLEKFNLGGPGPIRGGPGLGVDMANLERAAAALGITLDGSAASFRALQDALTDTITKLGEFGTDLQSAMQQAAAEIEIFGITDPREQFDVRTGAYRGRSTAFDSLFNFDLSTPEGRAAARAAAQDLFGVIKAGGERLDPDQFSGLSGQELVDAILAFVNGLNAIDEASGINTTTGTQADRMITADRTQITADQASRLLGLQQSQLNELRLIRQALTAAVTPIALPSAAVFASGGGGAMGGITINIANTYNATPAEIARLEAQSLGGLVELLKRELGLDVAIRKQYQGKGTIS